MVGLVINLLSRMARAQVMHNDFHSQNIAFVTRPGLGLQAVMIDVPTLTAPPCYQFILAYDAWFLRTNLRAPDTPGSLGALMKKGLQEYGAQVQREHPGSAKLLHAWILHRKYISRQERFDPTTYFHGQRETQLRPYHIDFYGRPIPLPPGCPTLT